MILTTEQKTILAFKTIMGLEDSNQDLFYAEELLSDAIWTEKSSIPGTAPVLSVGNTSGVVQLVEVTLNPVPGSPNAFFHDDLKQAIPTNYDRQGSYEWTFKRDDDTVINKGEGKWLKVIKSSKLVFYGDLPTGVSHSVPPKVQFYKYVGAQDDFGSGGSTPGNADEKYRGDHSANAGSTPNNGSGDGGEIRKGDFWTISVAGTINGVTPIDDLEIGDVIVARQDQATDGEHFFCVQGKIDISNKADTNDPRFPSSDEKAAMENANSPGSSNPFITQIQLESEQLTSDEKDAIQNSLSPSQSNPFVTVQFLSQELASLGQFVGDIDATQGLPSNGSGVGGSIVKGDYWRVTVAGTIAGLSPHQDLQSGDVVHARVDGASDVSDFFSTEGNRDISGKADVTDARFPNQDEKDAMTSSDEPSTENPFVTVSYFQDNQPGAFNGGYVGSHDASTGLPVTGSGSGGSILAGDMWTISVSGNVTGLGELAVDDILLSKVDGATSASDYVLMKKIRRYPLAFTSSNMSGDTLTVNHNLGKKYPASVSIYTDEDVKLPESNSKIKAITDTQLTIQIFLPVNNTWNLIIEI